MALGKRLQEGLRFTAVPTSIQTERIAREQKIPLVELTQVKHLDLTIDGADEISRNLDLIKGGGGALFREKMVASISGQLIIIAHDDKYVDQLGAFPLPVEVVPFGWKITCDRIRELGGAPDLRLHQGNPFKTDNDNYILDCDFGPITDPATLHQQLKLLPGVVETGLFVQMTDTVLIGYPDGKVACLTAGD
jgi:ribose 5-phosphate isomerase A